MKYRHRNLLAGLGEYVHGSGELPAVAVSDYNAELRDGDGLVGDRASRRAFQSILRRWQDRLPDGRLLPGSASGSLRAKTLDRILLGGKPHAAGLIMGAVEEFAHELAGVAKRLLRTPGWSGVRHIAVGGGLRASRVGELAIGRAAVLLLADGHGVKMRPIRHHPDEGGLIGSAHLVPTACLVGHDAVLAVDIGGTNIRAGLVELNLDDRPDLRAARVMGLRVWRHANEAPGRDEAVGRLAAMLTDLIRHARKQRFRLAPVVGVACPGAIGGDGSIKRGAQNLPGDWEAADFNLPLRLAGLLPKVDGQPVSVMMHNDAVIQGLSEQPWLGDTARWGVLTIGTGLGNASFQNREAR